MKSLQLIIAFFVLTLSMYSQVTEKTELRIAYTKYDSVDQIELIPLNVLNGEFDVLLIDSELKLINSNKDKSLVITWKSNNVDGRYDIVITPKQIYLKCGHENPNPNHLYWVDNINREQYELLSMNLIEYSNQETIEYINELPNQKWFYYKDFLQEEYKNEEWTDMQFENFTRVLSILNKPLKDINKQIYIPDKSVLEKMNPIRIAYGMNEIESPIKITKVE